jgi:hypothetical protein
VAALRLEARRDGNTLSKQLRMVLKEHFRQEYESGYTQSSGVPNLVALTRVTSFAYNVMVAAKKVEKTAKKVAKPTRMRD